MTAPTILTIGHSNHSVEKVIELANVHGVTAVADVRSLPYSRFNPDFNREFLQRKLKEKGIVYIFFGRELGARPEDAAYYNQGKVQYRKLSQSVHFKEGLSRLLTYAKSFNLVLLCSEKEPLACHRTLLVARELVALSISVAHIHADGSLESHSEAMTRLLRMLGKPDKDLYRTREEIIEDACALQEQRIGYYDEDAREEASA